MKEAKDNFSEQSTAYAKFRPTYPPELFEEILKHVGARRVCWDCATGNGQIAQVMANHFEMVFATDISSDQLKNAPSIDNVKYTKCRSEKTLFEANSIDLIMVGQAVHWFDHQHFNKEVVRVSKPNAIVSLIGYGLMFTKDGFDAELKTFYKNDIGQYWDPERKHIDSGYSSIPFPFEQIDMKKEFSIDVEWTLEQMRGYLNTWSSVRKYIRVNGKNPVTPFISSIVEDGIWKVNESKKLHFPLFVKLGIVRK